MNQIAQLNRRKFLGGYLAAEDALPLTNRASFFIGVTSSLVLPETILCSYYGILFATVLGACAFAGVSLGLTIYRRFPYQIITCVPIAATQVPVSQEQPKRKAA